MYRVTYNNMGTHPAALCLVIALSNVLLVVGAPMSIFSLFNSNTEQVNGVSVEDPFFYISSTTINNHKDECSDTVYVIGQGVNDKFNLPCDLNTGLQSSYGKDYALYDNPGEDFAFFTDTPSTLVVIQKDECTKRSYKTSQGKTTHSEKSMNVKECEEVKQKKDAKIKYWDQLKKDQAERRKKAFPSCFPFC